MAIELNQLKQIHFCPQLKKKKRKDLKGALFDDISVLIGPGLFIVEQPETILIGKYKGTFFAFDRFF
jgi:hypothetical protein